MKEKLKIIPIDLLEQYNLQVNKDLQILFDNLKDAEISTDSFSFYTSVSSVFSSKIEGEEIELDSYIRHKKFGIEFLPDYTKKIEDLYNAYTFSKSNVLNKENKEEAQKILADAQAQVDKIKAETQVQVDKLKAEGYAQADKMIEQATNPIAKIAAKKAAELAKKEVDKQAQKLVDESEARCNKILEDAKTKSAAAAAK